MQTNRYTVADLATKTEMRAFPHTPEGLTDAERHADDQRTADPNGEYAVIEIRIVYMAR